MVGQLIRLKLKMLWNAMRAQTVVLVLSILGLLYFGALGIGILVGTAFLARQVDTPPEAALYFTAVGPAVFTLWILVPIIFASMDNTLDPVRLSPYVGPSRTLGAGLIAATGVGPGGAISVFLLALPVWFSAWNGQWGSALTWTLSGIITFALSLMWARGIGTWFAVRLSSSGKKDLVTLLGGLLFLIAVAPLGVWITLLANNFSVAALEAGLRIAYWTPLGAPYGMIHSLMDGAYLAALVRLLIVAITAVAGWALWMRVLGPVMSGYPGKISNEARHAIAEGRYLIDENLARSERDARIAQTRAAGLRTVDIFTRIGMGPRSASLAARTLRYWIRDPRLSMNVIMLLFFPILALLFRTINIEGGPSFTGTIFLYLVPITVGLTIGALMQYDSTGAWIVISSGMKGREERLGRLVGSLPVVLLLQVGSYVLYDVLADSDAQTFWYHQLIGIILLSGAAGTTLLLNARWVYPVQPPGVSPMATKGTGSFLTTMLIQLVSFAGVAVLQIPSYVMLALFSFGIVPLWSVSIVGLIWSVAILAGAVLVGGTIWDRYAVHVLAQIRSWPGH